MNIIKIIIIIIIFNIYIMNILIINLFNKLINYIEQENKLVVLKTDKIKNNFRISKLKNVVNIIKKLTYNIKSIKDIENIKGIGKNSINRIEEILKTNKLNELEEYSKKYDNINNNKIKLINDLNNIIGIGNTNANNIIDKYKINSIYEFIDGVNNNKIKVNNKIKLGVKYYNKYLSIIPYETITNINKYLNKINDDDNLNIIICGSYRRENNYSSDIDIIITNFNYIIDKDIQKNYLKNYINKLKEYNFIIDDITDNNIFTKYMGFCKYNNDIMRIDIRLIPYISIYSATLYFTGSKILNKIMRTKAYKLGYKLSEYGLLDIITNKYIDIYSEKDIFDKLNMDYLEPNKRNIF